MSDKGKGGYGGDADASRTDATQPITWTNTMGAIFLKFKPCMDENYPAINLGVYSAPDGTGVADNISAVQAAIDGGYMPEQDPANPPPNGPDYVGMWAQLNGKALFDQWYAAGYPE